MWFCYIRTSKIVLVVVFLSFFHSFDDEFVVAQFELINNWILPVVLVNEIPNENVFELLGLKIINNILLV